MSSASPRKLYSALLLELAMAVITGGLFWFLAGSTLGWF